MRNSLLCLSAVLLLSSSAYAGVCENAIRGFQRKADSAKAKCENNAPIDKLKARLATAKTDKSKANIQRSIDKAIAKQQKYCAQATTFTAAVSKIQSFCANAASANTGYCKFGYSLRIRGTDASSRCKRGRLWFPDKNACYYEEEWYYTSQAAFGNGIGTGRGEILYSGQPGENFYQINVGFLVSEAHSQEDCE